MICFFCGSSSRNRHIASLILGKLFKNLPSIARIPEIETNIQIYDMAADNVFSRYLRSYGNYRSSDFFPEIPAGQLIRENLFCQNVEQLTFTNESFDLVVSEDVFEHVRDYKKGFHEVARVLKPGGHHIFTVPCYFDKKTLIRVDTTGTQDVYLMPPEYHGDAVRGQILAYRTFGLDIFDDLSECGFNTELFTSRYMDQASGIFDSFVFVATKNV